MQQLQKSIYDLTMMQKRMRTLGEWSEIAQDDWLEIAQVRCIEDVKSNLRENHMEFDNQGNDEDIEKVLVGQPKPVDVLHPLQNIKILELNQIAYTFFISDTILRLTSVIHPGHSSETRVFQYSVKRRKQETLKCKDLIKH